MVKIRLRRMGAKKNPYYRIVVADSRFPRDGRCIEELGTYVPPTQPVTITVDADKAKEWIKNGAQPTDTVVSLLKASGDCYQDLTYRDRRRRASVPADLAVGERVARGGDA